MTELKPIQQRVECSLRRLGCLDIEAIDLENGRVKIVGPASTRDECALVKAMAKTVPGVVAIDIDFASPS